MTAFVLGQPSYRTVTRNVNVVNGVADPVELSFASGHTVRGRVTINGGPPPANVHLEFTSRDRSVTTTSSIDGAYLVSGLPPGDYTISASCPVMIGGAKGKYTVEGEAIHDLDILASMVTIRVLDSAGAPVPDSQVSIWGLNGTSGTRISTDAEGRVSGLITQGRMRVDVQKSGFAGISREIVVTAGAQEFEYQLSPGTPVTVRVADARDGTPLMASVSAWDAKNRTTHSATATTREGLTQLWLARTARH